MLFVVVADVLYILGQGKDNIQHTRKQINSQRFVQQEGALEIIFPHKQMGK